MTKKKTVSAASTSEEVAKANSLLQDKSRGRRGAGSQAGSRRKSRCG